MRTAIMTLVLAGVAPTAYAQVDPMLDQQLRAALESIDAARPVDGIRELHGLMGSLSSAAPPAFRARVWMALGEAHFTLGFRDSAVTDFREAVYADPFVEPDLDRINPTIRAVFDSAASTASVVAMRRPPDTTITRPDGDEWPVELAGGAAGEATFALSDADGQAVSVTRARLERRLRHTVSFMRTETQPVEPGVYDLRISFGADQGGVDTLEVELQIARLPVDTASHPLPPDSSQYMAETRLGPRKTSSLLKGLALGAAAAAIPIVLASSEFGNDGLQPGGIAVGASLGIAGIVGMVSGREDLPVEENIAFNARLRSDWRIAVQETASENERRLRLAPLRITVTRGPDR